MTAIGGRLGKPVIFVLGGPGSGKGSQCSKIAADTDFGYFHVCPGDLLRLEADKGTEEGRRLNEIMKSGGLVSSEKVVDLIKAKMLENAESAGFLIDGFPRDLEEGDRLFREKVCECTAVLMFDCTEEAMVERLLERGKTSGRVDDSEETIIRTRIQTFRQQTQPVIDHYQQLGKLRKVNSTRPVDEVYEEVKKILTVLAKTR